MLSRRDLLRLLGAAVAVSKLPACGTSSRPRTGVFTAAQLAMLDGFADVIIPPDDQPGGSALGVVAYIENLLAAFTTNDTPAIYAGGPFSGRTTDANGDAVANDFETFIELDRVLDFAWRVQLLGSDGVGGAPNDALLGPVVALKDQLTTGLDMAQTVMTGKPDYAFIFGAMTPDFQQLVFDLVTQAAWAAPEYGGNPELAGWDMVHFEGDSLPLGYTQWNGTGYTERPEAPMSTANPSDPEPLTADVEALLDEVVSALGGMQAAAVRGRAARPNALPARKASSS
jgi:hypothetical protein